MSDQSYGANYQVRARKRVEELLPQPDQVLHTIRLDTDPPMRLRIQLIMDRRREPRFVLDMRTEVERGGNRAYPFGGCRIPLSHVPALIGSLMKMHCMVDTPPRPKSDDPAPGPTR